MHNSTKVNSHLTSLARSHSHLTILVDMDGVIVDWDKGFENVWAGRSRLERHKSYIIQDCVPLEFKPEATAITRRAGFFASLPPYPDAIASVKQLSTIPGIHVLLCSSPLLANPTCVQDKMSWVQQHFRGDILIDDKPVVTGAFSPTWTQTVFHQPYNAHLCGNTYKYRITSWTNSQQWKNVLLNALRDAGHQIHSLDS